MPNAGTQQSRKQNAQASGRAPQPLPSTAELQTPDHIYGVVSVLYHALQGAQTYEQYIRDAEQENDSELVKFFEQCRDEEEQRAERAKVLLAGRLEEAADEEDDDEEGDDDDEESEDSP